MRGIRTVSTGVLLLLLGIAAPIHANQQRDQGKEQQDKDKQQQQPQAQQRQENQNRQQQQRAQQQPQGQNRQQQQRAQQQPQGQNRQQQQQRAQQQPREQNRQQQQHAQQQQQAQNRQQQQAAWRERRARDWQTEHRTWQQRGGYHGYRIPPDRYRTYFGPNHWFRVYRYRVVVVGGYPRFLYGGFWISVVDPWPQYWQDDWYDTDDVYIAYSGDGYYLYNRRYPRDRIAIMIYVN